MLGCEPSLGLGGSIVAIFRGDADSCRHRNMGSCQNYGPFLGP